MKKTSNLIFIASTWVIVMILLSVVLFFLRLIPQIAYYTTWPGKAERSPVGLYPDSVENDPRAVKPSRATASLLYDPPLGAFTTVQQSLISAATTLMIYFADESGHPKTYTYEYFDKNTGLIAFGKATMTRAEGNLIWAQKHVYAYIGPDGISQNPEKALGRFIDPVWETTWQSAVIYDRSIRKFIFADLENKITKQTAQMPDNFKLSQLTILPRWSTLEKNGALLNSYTSPPFRYGDPNITRNKKKEVTESLYGLPDYNPAAKLMPLPVIIDTNGRISRIDTDTMKILPAGWIPTGINNSLSYRVHPVEINAQYTGLVVASIWRDWTGPQLTVFDASGNVLPENGKGTRSHEQLRDHDLMELSRGIIDLLQPSILGFSSYLFGSNIEAMAGQQSIFILPDSFLGQLRQTDGMRTTLESIVMCALLLLPQLLVGFLIAMQINRNAKSYGLESTQRTIWMIAAVLLGISIYITYRLTRTDYVLITCNNCGLPRRPDTEKCHHCGAKLELPTPQNIFAVKN